MIIAAVSVYIICGFIFLRTMDHACGLSNRWVIEDCFIIARWPLEFTMVLMLLVLGFFREWIEGFGYGTESVIATCERVNVVVWIAVLLGVVVQIVS